MNPETDWFFEKDDKWQEAYKRLRSIVLDCGLTEELKWGVPCYTYRGSNVVLIHGFKSYCALLFHKGALLSDTDCILVQQTKHVQAARQIRFRSIEDIERCKTSIKAYIYEAVEVEKAGLEVRFKKTADFEIPVEFQDALNADGKLKKAFETLTPGRQRGYLLYFADAKQSKTRVLRIEKSKSKILDGKGLND